MKIISKKQQQKNNILTKIKSNLEKKCFLCGKPANDLAHILPKSLYPEYYTEKRNLIILCRECHNQFDNNIEFRQQKIELYNIAKQIDEQAAKKYFKIFTKK
jgi:5-methylcytosine-specific restriction endonuclease McrA